MRKAVVGIWSYVFDSTFSPLRHIPNLNTRHMVLQLLGWMWALSFSITIGSYTVCQMGLIGHFVLIGAAGITVATYTAAATRPKLFTGKLLFTAGSGRRSDGEHL
ncbi:MAG: hypothetical protein JWO15_2345 [Sphingomonadales bacterium]|nr:hypothetical protein [Sphingomonadales bacterium]